MTEYWKDLVDRAVKTAAQAAALSIGAESLEANAFTVDWTTAAGFALGGAALSLLTNLGQKGIFGKE